MFLLNYKNVIFFYPRIDVANDQDNIPYQLIVWRIFPSSLNKNNKKICIEIGKSIPNHGLVLNYGKTC